MSITLGELRSEVKFRLQNHPRFTDTIVDLGINRGIQDLIIFTRTFDDVANGDIEADPGTGEFPQEIPLPPDLLMLRTVSFHPGGQGGQVLEEKSQQEYAETNGEFSRRQGDPFGFYIRNNSILHLYPKPIRPGIIQIYYVKKPADLVADGDLLPVDRIYTDAIRSYALWYCLNGQPGEQDRANTFRAYYKEQRAEAKTNLNLNTVLKTRRVR